MKPDRANTEAPAGGAKLATLIVEDDEAFRYTLERSLRARGHDVRAVGTVAEARAFLPEQRIDVAVIDMRLPDGSGLEVVKAALEVDPEVLAIVISGVSDVKAAVRAIKHGAAEYVVKPFDLDDLHLVVQRSVEARATRRRLRQLERERQGREPVADFLGTSPAIEQVRGAIQRVAPLDTPVLVLGETGTGKELVADSLHRLSPRAKGPFIKTNFSALSEQLVESELFGHEKGSFTDAKDARPGLIEMAAGGTLLLDEIAETKLSLQSTLLRVLDGQPFRRVGGQREIRPDVRLVAATNRDLAARIRTGEFREDLYFRLNVFRIEVPPLRARGADVLLLARHFLKEAARTLRTRARRVSPAAEALLRAYPWPGNVRELRNIMERAAIVCDGDEIDVGHIPKDLRTEGFFHGIAKGTADLDTLAEMERRYVVHVVESSGGNLTEAARILGIARNTLKSKLRGTPGDAADRR
jgi:DNA-binding NtrC family response regulator